MTKLPNAAITKLSATQTLVLTAGAQRPSYLALPLPKGLAGAAAKMAVNRMVEHGWLQERDANLRRGEPFWRDMGDGHGTTLVVTDSGLLAIGIEPVVAKAIVASCEQGIISSTPKTPTKGAAGTKQALLIEMLQTAEGASAAEIVAATGWLAHTARGVISGVIKKKLRLVVAAANIEGRGLVYRIT